MALNGLFCADVPLRNYSLTEEETKDRERQHELEKIQACRGYGYPWIYPCVDIRRGD